MKKYIISMILISLLGIFPVKAQEDMGMHVEHASWKEVMEKAKAEKKLVFVDFYTQWCGPCFNMAENVFTLPEVGYFYNNNFVCTKVDCENGEGIDLKKKYDVRLYPTYLFIDPETEEAVHYSKSSQSPEQFIFTGQSALDPQKRSIYLEKEFESGSQSVELLTNYILYQTSIYQQEKAKTAFDKLISGGKKLKDKEIWSLFVKTIQGIDNPYIQEVSRNYADFVSLFGKAAVDEKLAKETTYGDLEVIGNLCNFDGKAFNIELIHINKAIQNKNYENASKRIDALIADSLNTDRQKLIDRLKYIARYISSDKQLPDKYYNKYIEYLRFIAYNDENKKDPYIHFEYAAALENVIEKLKNKGALEEMIANPPKSGKTSYSMRPSALKLKPVKK